MHLSIGAGLAQGLSSALGRGALTFGVLLLVGALGCGSGASRADSGAPTAATAVELTSVATLSTATATPEVQAQEVTESEPSSSQPAGQPAAAQQVAAVVPAARAVSAAPHGISRIRSSSLGINHTVEVVAVVSGEMQSPADGVNGVGWYPAFSLPGQVGNAVFSAHETWNRQRGPFYGLHLASAGAEISVEMTDGRALRYQVISNTRYAVANMPTTDIVYATDRPWDEEWITLITCGGRIVYQGSAFGEYLDRDVVVARRVY